MESTTVSKSAGRLGYQSSSQLYRLLNDGYLHEHFHVQQHSGHRLVDIEGLWEKRQCICHWHPCAMFLRRNVIELATDKDEEASVFCSTR